MEQVRRAYGAVAEKYIELFGSRAQVHADDLALITRRLTLRGTVLDVGCGPGHLTAHLRSLEVDAIGIDLVRSSSTTPGPRTQAVATQSARCTSYPSPPGPWPAFWRGTR